MTLILLSAVVVAFCVGGFACRIVSQRKELSRQLPEGTHASPPQLLGQGPYRSGTSGEGAIGPADETSTGYLVLAKPLSDSEVFDKLVLGQHCMAPEDPQIVAWANSMSVGFLVKQLDDGDHDSAALAFRIRRRPDDAVALIPLSHSRFAICRHMVSEALDGNNSVEAVAALINLLDGGELLTSTRAKAQTALDQHLKDGAARGLANLLTADTIDAKTKKNIIGYFASKPEVAPDFTKQLMIKRVLDTSLKSAERSEAAKALAKLPGGKELLRDILVQ